MPAVGGEANLPNWVLADISPDSGTDVQSLGGSLSQDWQQALIWCNIGVGTNSSASIQFNGVTTADYEFVSGGSTTLSVDRIPIHPGGNQQTVSCVGRVWYDQQNGPTVAALGSTCYPLEAGHTEWGHLPGFAGGGPISSIEVVGSDGNTISGTLEVWVR